MISLRVLGPVFKLHGASYIVTVEINTTPVLFSQQTLGKDSLVQKFNLNW